VGDWLPILTAVVATVFVAGLGAALTTLDDWYRNLRKPSWQPPDWLFGPAWTLIFTLTAIAGLLAWNGASDGEGQRRIIGAFAINGVLNILWSALFFKTRRPDWALVEVVLLWFSVAALILVVVPYSVRAAWLLLPYLFWVAFAAYLNLAVVRLNYPFSR
jgi:translocator protein